MKDKIDCLREENQRLQARLNNALAEIETQNKIISSLSKLSESLEKEAELKEKFND